MFVLTAAPCPPLNESCKVITQLLLHYELEEYRKTLAPVVLYSMLEMLDVEAALNT